MNRTEERANVALLLKNVQTKQMGGFFLAQNDTVSGCRLSQPWDYSWPIWHVKCSSHHHWNFSLTKTDFFFPVKRSWTEPNALWFVNWFHGIRNRGNILVSLFTFYAWVLPREYCSSDVTVSADPAHKKTFSNKSNIKKGPSEIKSKDNNWHW